MAILVIFFFIVLLFYLCRVVKELNRRLDSLAAEIRNESRHGTERTEQVLFAFSSASTKILNGQEMLSADIASGNEMLRLYINSSNESMESAIVKAIDDAFDMTAQDKLSDTVMQGISNLMNYEGKRGGGNG